MGLTRLVVLAAASAAAALVAALGAPASTARQGAANPVKIFDNGNIAAVQNGPSSPTIFRTTKPWRIVQIWTYHWNDAKGATPGTISLLDLTAKRRYGPFRAIGTPGQGGVPNAYWHVDVGFDIQPGRYRVLDSDVATWSQNAENGHRGMAFVMARPAAAGWPPLPSALVTLASVANGCGPSDKATRDKRFFDTSTYYETNNPLGPKFTVNFRTACDLHDAGYNGARVRDPLNGNAILDHFDWSQDRIDGKFLRDMRLICDQQIPATAPNARTDCKLRGGKLSIGALTRYNAVRAAGSFSWVGRPRLSGVWVDMASASGSAFNVVQKSRYVRGLWRDGEFRGTLISRDGDTLVKGFARLVKDGAATFTPMSFAWSPKSPDRIVIRGGGISGVRTR